MSEIVSEKKIIEWLTVSLKNHDIHDYTIHDIHKTATNEGYSSDIVSVIVSGKRKSNGEKAEHNIILKVSKENSTEDKAQLRNLYVRELFLYSDVFPEFRKFELDRNIQRIFNSVPECFYTLISDDKEILVLENLKTRGYQLHERQLPMDLSHVELVLKSYAKFHAIAFAFKDQRKYEFEQLTANYTSGYNTVLNSAIGASLFGSLPAWTFDMLQKSNHQLASKVKTEIIDNGTLKLLIELSNMAVEEVVISHSDCWNNNFLFKYESNGKSNPIDVKILDWQLSGLHSPMMDIANFLFLSISEEQFSDIDGLLEYYHLRLSKFITELGSDAEKIFPYSTMLNHWKQFSLLGMIYTLTFLPMVLLENLGVLQEDSNAIIGALDAAAGTGSFQGRLFAALKYYFDLVQ